MNIFTKQDLDLLMQQETIGQSISISIFMPAFRAGADAQQGPSRLKNLVREAEKRLNKAGLREITTSKILAPVQDLINDNFFWQNQSDGLAIFSSLQSFRYYRLPIHFKELVIVGSRFYIKPLFSLITEDGRFYILVVSQKVIKLLQCTRFGYNELPLPERVPTSLAEAMKYEDLDRSSQFYGHVGETGYHGHIGTEAIGTAMISHGRTVVQENKDRILRYFRDIDRGLKEILRDENAPLLFSGVDYLFPIYRQANSYQNLMDTFIPGNPDKTATQAIHKIAWDIISPIYKQGKVVALAKYRRLAGTGFTSVDPSAIINSSIHGKVDTLFVDEEHKLWGTFDSESLNIIMHKEPEPYDEDLIGIAVANTIKSRGSVYIVKKEELPDITPVAAILRQGTYHAA